MTSLVAAFGGYARSMQAEPWWKRRAPNRWLHIGMIGLSTFGVGFSLRWLDGDPNEDLRYYGYPALLSLAVVAVGGMLYIKARRSPSA